MTDHATAGLDTNQLVANLCGQILGLEADRKGKSLQICTDYVTLAQFQWMRLVWLAELIQRGRGI